MKIAQDTSPNRALTNLLPKPKMLVVIDAGVETPEVLIAGVLPGIEVVLLNDREDGITQISRILAANPAQTLHIACHGSRGQLHLGNSVLNQGNYTQYQEQLQVWGLSELVLYACEVGQDRNFIASLSEQTGARVAASLSKVGHITQGGSWQLAYQNGDRVETLAFDHEARQTYAGVLVSFTAQTTFAAGDDPYAVAVGDFNGDGFRDLVVANGDTPGTVSVFLGNGSGSFSAQTTFATGGNDPEGVAVGDFNADGNPDLAAANSGSNTLSVRLGNGSGGFSPATTFAAGTTSRFVVVADFNRNGTPDLAVANQGSDNVSVLLGGGGGSFNPQVTFAAGDGAYSLAVGDFNRDSRPDLAVANRNSANVSVLLGNGSGGFSPQEVFAAGDSPSSVAVGDFNGDSKPDLVVANEDSNNLSVRLGDGSGSFSLQTTFAVGVDPYSVAVGDFDGDSLRDLAVVTQGDDNVSVLLGNGSGSFIAQTTFAVGDNPYYVAVGDFNGDSKPDLVTANETSNNVSVLLNSTIFPILGTAGNDTLIGTAGNDSISGLGGNDLLSGLAGNDSLNGGIGSDILIGGFGNDTMLGGFGNDIYFRDSAADIITETSALLTEIDTVQSSVTTFLGANLERLILTGIIAINGSGNALNNSITGNSNANALNGGIGNDTLTGGLGNDNLTGGAGSDRLISGTPNDADIFRFTTITERIDTITDFDRINSGAIAGDDRDIIRVLNTGFNPTGGASDLINGVLPAARFVNGAVSLGAASGFRYFQGTGQLFFDSNGGTHDVGVGSLLLATLTNLPTFASMAGSIQVV